MADNILEVKRLKVSFRTNNGTVKAVRDISFNLERGKTLAIVGESGSGKSVTSKVIMGISAANAIIESGEVLYDGKDIVKIGEDEMYELRGDKIAMIFQDPLSSLNPIVKIGKQITEAMLLKNEAKRKRSRKEFNTRLACLKELMIESNKNNSSLPEEEINNLCKEFNDFNIQSNSMQNSFNESYDACNSFVGITKDFLFIAEKKRKQNVSSYLFEAKKLWANIKDEFFCNNYYDQVLNYYLGLDGLYKLYKKLNKAECPDDVIVKAKEILDFAEKLLAQTEPNFFRYGYYTLHNDKSELLSMSVKDADDMALRYLDDNFMNRWIKATTSSVKLSFDKALESKKDVLPFLKTCKETFNKPSFTKEEASNLVKESRTLIAKSIDKLATRKDSIALTFSSALEGFVKKFFDACKNNEKEVARFKKQSEKRDELIKKGKNVSWKVVPASIISLEDIIYDINSLLDNMIKNYNTLIEEAAFVDYNKLCIDLIDFFKEKASDYVYKISNEAAKEKVIKLMDEVGIPEPRLRFNQYPFEFSGGMRQRIVIAIALCANPEILICDEPTTALDVTIQSQILELINNLKRERNLSVIFITHDLGVVANMADQIAVMYAGKIVEYGTSEEIFYSPAHPYTWALLSSMPDLDTKEKLEAIPGTPPNMIYPPVGDAFAARNKYALKIDYELQPPMFKITDTHYAATWLLDPRAPKIKMPKIISDRIKRMRENGGKKNEQ